MSTTNNNQVQIQVQAQDHANAITHALVQEKEEVFEKRGVSIELLKAIRDLALKRNDNKEYWTIARISAYINGNHEILKSNCRFPNVDPNLTLTYSSESSLIDMLKNDHSILPHPLLNVTYDQVVNDKANIFVSFAYSNNFCELVDAIENHLQTITRPIFLWIDLFVNNQWIAADKSFEWWATTFRTAVNDIGETLLFLEPWNEPAMLKRAWCLYEISCSKSIDIAMSKDQSKLLKDGLMKGGKTVQNIIGNLSNIDLEKADAYLIDDKEKIFRAVNSMDGGFHKFNVTVLSLINKWVINEIRKQVDESMNDSLLEFERICELYKSAMILQHQAQYKESELILKRLISALETFYDVTSEDDEVYHQYTMILSAMAINYRKTNQLQESLKYFKLALSGKEKYLGFNHSDTLQCVNSYGNCLRDCGKLNEAKAMYERVVNGFQVLFGINHFDTLLAMDCLANLISDQGNLKDAQVLYERVIEGHEALDSHDIGYLNALNNISINLMHLGRGEEALRYGEKSWKVSEKRLGESHPTTTTHLRNYTLHLLRMGKSEASFYGKKLLALYDKYGDPDGMALMFKTIFNNRDDQISSDFNFNFNDDLTDDNTSNSVIIKNAIKLKDEASSLYSQCKHTQVIVTAMTRYKKSLEQLDKVTSPNPEETKQIEDLKLKLFLNIAQCSIVVEDWDNVIESCNQALRIDAKSSKALYRRACSFEAKKKLQLALLDLDEAKRTSKDVAIDTAIERIKRNISSEQVASASDEPLLFTPSELEEITEKFCKARGLSIFETDQQHHVTRKLVEVGNVNEINNSGKMMCSIIKRNYITKDKEPNEMSVKELKETIIRAGLLAQTKCFTEKSEYVSLLTKYIEENPIKFWAEADIMEQMVTENVLKAKKFHQSNRLDEARQHYALALNALEVEHGLDDLRTINITIDYANVLYELGTHNGTDRDCLSGSSEIFKKIINRMTNSLGVSNDVIIKCNQCLRRNKHILGNYKSSDSTDNNKEYLSIHIRLVCHPAVMTDRRRAHELINKTLKVINQCNSNDKLLQLRDDIKYLLHHVKHPTYDENKISTICNNKYDHQLFNDAIIKFESCLSNLAISSQ